jgi:Lon protease-like protein
VRRKKQPTDADQLADYAVRLLEIATEKRALKLSRDEAWDIRTELFTVLKVLRTVQERLMDRIYETRP